MSDHSKLLLKDVNLAKVDFSGTGRGLELEFIDMDQGCHLAYLRLVGIVLFHYQNSFEDDDEAFPTYIGEVTSSPIESHNAASMLAATGYGFCDPNGKLLVPNESHSLIHIEGGDVSLSIVCKGFALEMVES